VKPIAAIAIESVSAAAARRVGEDAKARRYGGASC
jgi:hypothetical protein